jgi:peptidoglycan/LPS O-acetylase OafA/YrhL
MSTRIQTLDGLRGVAILMVFGYHGIYGKIGHYFPVAIQRLFEVGWCGVDLFFVLSGFLITGILLDTKHRRAGEYFRNFYVRRTIRIFPLYYVTILFLILVSGYLGGAFKKIYTDQAWYWTYTCNLLFTFQGHPSGPAGHFWSLAIEEQFYLLWPLMVYLCPKKVFVAVCLALVSLAPCLRVAMHLSNVESGSIYNFTLCRIDPLAMGALIAVLSRSEDGIKLLRTFTKPILFVSLVSIIIIICTRHDLSPEDVVLYTLGFSLFAFFFGAILTFIGPISSNGIFCRSFEWSPLRYIGRISYGIYVFHYLWINFFETSLWQSIFGNSHLIKAVAYFGGTFGMALVSWYFFESQVLKLKDRFV